MRESIREMDDLCAVEVATELVGGKWKLVILEYLQDGPIRFGALRRAMPRVTPRMLTRQLRELESDGIVARTVYTQVPPKVEYSLTEAGRRLSPIVRSMREWGDWYRATDPTRRAAPS